MESANNLQTIIKNKLKGDNLKKFNRIYYGREDHCEISLKETTIEASKLNDFEIAAYAFPAAREEIRPRRIVKIALIQNSIVLPTDKPVKEQRDAIFEKVKKLIEISAAEGVNIICLQEAWYTPFFLCTREKYPWDEMAESPEMGPSFVFLRELAAKYKMVIVSPIFEKDANGKMWNTAVVIDDKGKFMGKHRKNHLPSVGSFSETSYYSEGDTGHPVFNTTFGKIAVNICYGRHHPQNWLMFALNGAEIVFNPSATIAEFGESFWSIEARNAAVANSYFTCSINRVGSEQFSWKVGSSEEFKEVTRNYYGSSYVTGPDGCMTPSLSKISDGILIAEIDLNLCRQVKDKWGFNMTSRLDVFSKELNEFVNAKKN